MGNEAAKTLLMAYFTAEAARLALGECPVNFSVLKLLLEIRPDETINVLRAIPNGMDPHTLSELVGTISQVTGGIPKDIRDATSQQSLTVQNIISQATPENERQGFLANLTRQTKKKPLNNSIAPIVENQDGKGLG